MNNTLKRILAVVAVLALLCTAIPFGVVLFTDASTNLFTNGDFESGDYGWTLKGETAVDTTDAYSGSKSLLLSMSNAYGEAAVQTVTVKPNTDYVFSCWIKRVSGGGAWNAYSLDAGNAYKQIALTSGQTFYTSTSKQWSQLTYTFNSGSLTSVFFKFSPETASAGTILVDDVTLVAKDEIVVTKGVINGDFENGTNGWTVKAPTALDSSNPHGGKNALLLSFASAYGEAAVQTIAVDPNTNYTLTYWVQRHSGGGAWNVYVLDPAKNYELIKFTTGQNFFSDSSKNWVKKTATFNSGNRTEVFLKFCPETTNSGTFLLDDVSVLPEGQEPDTPVTPPDPNAESLTLSRYTIENNRPATIASNLIINGGFEYSNGAPWNKNTFLANNVTVVEDATAPEGTHSLFFNTSGTTENEKHIFWVDVEPNTTYVFSTWLKGSFLSAESVGRATVGVIDPDTQKYLVMPGKKISTDERQIVPPAWDNKWHLRSVVFNSASKTKVGIAMQGYGTELWLDDMALFTVDAGVKYADPKTFGTMSYSYAFDNSITDRSHNLVGDSTMDQAGANFWQSGSGWKNDFMSIRKATEGYGNSLCYTASDNPLGVRYVKWIPVKPNTDYVFSIDVKVLKDGGGRFVLVDGKKMNSSDVLQVDFSTSDFGSDWFHMGIGFNSGPFATVGIGVVDGGGEALLDNIHLFEKKDGTGNSSLFIKTPTAAQLATTIAKAGQKASFTVNATGEGLTYQWYFKDVGASKFSLTNSYKSKTYSLEMTEARDGRQIYCVVTDKHGYSVQSRTVTLHMGTPFSVTQPSAQAVYAKNGATAKIALKATGSGLKYTWYIKNSGQTKYSKSSITKNTYSVAMSSNSHDRRVYCVVTDKFGNSYTTKTYVLRRQATITAEPDTVRYAKMGAKASAKITAVGDSLKYTWYVKNEGATKYSKSSITSATYSVTMSSKVKGRRIYCIVTDKYGKTVQSKTFLLRESVSIKTQPKSVTVANGKTASVTVKASGDGLKYVWYVKNAGASKYTKSSITKSTYSVKMTSKVNGRRLICYVYDKYGNKVQTNTVILKKK